MICCFSYRRRIEILALLIRPLGFIAPKTLKIIWLSNLSTLSVPDEGYSNLLTLSVPDEGYSNLLTLSVPDEGYSNLLTLSVSDEGYSRNAEFDLIFILY
jgi:hypothetical protein